VYWTNLPQKGDGNKKRAVDRAYTTRKGMIAISLIILSPDDYRHCAIGDSNSQ
jgi:hypothetical protein